MAHIRTLNMLHGAELVLDMGASSFHPMLRASRVNQATANEQLLPKQPIPP